MIRATNPKTWEELQEVEPVKPPRAGRFWTGVRHSELLDAVQRNLKTWGFQKAGPWTIDLSYNDHDMTASCVLESSTKDVKLPKGLSLSVAVVNSNSQKRAMALAAGWVWNLWGCGVPVSWCFGRRHTNRLNLGDAAAELVGEFRHAVRLDVIVRRAAEAMKDWKPSDSAAKTLLMAAAERTDHSNPAKTVLPWNNMEAVAARWSAVAPRDRTGLELMRCFAQSCCDKDPAHRQLDRLFAFAEMIHVTASVKTAPSGPDLPPGRPRTRGRGDRAAKAV